VRYGANGGLLFSVDGSLYLANPSDKLDPKEYIQSIGSTAFRSALLLPFWTPEKLNSGTHTVQSWKSPIWD